MADSPLWTPTEAQIKATNVAAFAEGLKQQTGGFSSYRALHAWSVANRAEFWSALWDFAGVIGEKGARALGRDTMPGAEFFPDAKLNFAENLLRRRDDGEALVFRGEDKAEKRMSWAELSALVSRLQQAMRAAGVGVGDRVAAMLPNLPESIAIMLAATSIGAVFSSCSPDFGERGVLDRFGQIEPKLFFACDGYWYAGKRLPILDKLQAIVSGLPSAEKVIIVDYLGDAAATAQALPRAATLADLIAPHQPREPEFTPLPFAHPAYILYSSGTTGAPKCIVHSAGGALLKHLSEHRFNCDVKPGDRVFYFTTMGWMMWNWLVSALASEATLILYDGSPFHPVNSVLFDYAEAEKVTLFGTSAKYIDACKKAELAPKSTHDLASVRLICSTGSPLAAESFDYVYSHVTDKAQLASVSGGTDIVACFVAGDPTAPVWRGEIQAPTLGVAIDVWGDDGQHLARGKGELVCAKAFPSMPVKFWNDPEGAKFRAAYFERYPGIWCQGDFAEWTEHDGIIIHGRSDATLNPGGVRIGTAEIYAQVEQIPEVVEGICIGQDWDNDVRVVLFVRLKEGATLDADLEKAIKSKIRAGASPRHVPAKIVQVADIPRTKSGKITELAVRDVVHGRDVKNKEALANPEALDLYRDMPALRS
ncbi:acetoacetate--CoA ligase [Terrarubrum flagellatum]|uniref:acetoacetate--CoA ligase n=1 Tax=Terrirubrum flagellatum TaxID=2895980 RepID=UPI00314540A6